MQVTWNVFKKAKINLIAVGGMLLAMAAHANFPAPEYIGPQPEPAYIWTDHFDPPVTNVSPNSGTPQIAEWTRINEPGDTMALAGEELSLWQTYGKAEGFDTRFAFYDENAGVVDGLIQRLSGRQAAVTLDSSLTPASMYLMWPRNKAGYGRPVAVNRTEVWWIGPDLVSAGERFSVYGRNLTLNNEPCRLYMDGYGWISSVTANPYKADFELPADVQNGTYNVYAHNGSGGRYGWSGAKELEVKAALTWDAGTVRAKSASYADVKAAINAAGDYYTVEIPAGICEVEADIILPDNIWLKGAGQGATIFKPAAGWTGFSLIENARSLAGGSVLRDLRNAKISDITFSQGSGTPIPKNLVRICGIRTIIENCEFTHKDLTSAASVGTYILSIERSSYHTQGPEHVWIRNCTFNHGSSVFVSGKQVFYENNTNNGMFDLGSLVLMAARESSYTGNLGQNLDSSVTTSGYGWARGRFFVAQEAINPRINVYIGENTTKDMNPRYDETRDPFDQVEQNAGEQILFEALKARYRGAVVSADQQSVTCSGLATDYKGLMVAIVSGRGTGQVRYISSVNTSTGKVSLSEPWNVAPDASSIAVIGLFNSHIAVHGNNLDAAPHNLDVNFPRWTASTGVSFYGGVSDSIVANNTISEMRTGLYNWGRYHSNNEQGVPVVEPVFFNTFIRNHIVSARYGITGYVDDYHLPPHVDTAVLGSVWRNNNISKVTERLLAFNSSANVVYPDMVVFDGNHASGSIVNIGSHESKNYVFINNEITGSGSGFNFATASRPALRGNTITGFSSDYSGHMPGKTLEVPIRVVELNAENATASIPVWNSGTDRLSWSSRSDKSWVSITSWSGDVNGETAEGTLTFSIDKSTAPSEGEAVIDVYTTDGSQTRQVTVYYKADGTEPTTPGNPPEAILERIEIQGESSLAEQTAGTYSCMAFYSDNTQVEVAAEWTLSSGAPATISSDGVLSAGDVDANADVVVSAGFEGLSADLDVAILYVAPVLTGLSIEGPVELTEGTSAGYTCYASYSDGAVIEVAPEWSASSSVVSILSSGLLTAREVSADETVGITATFGGLSDSMSVLISDVSVPVEVTGLSISGPSLVNELSEARFSCSVSYSDGSSEVVTAQWTVSNNGAVINGTGLCLFGNIDADQVVTIGATYNGQTTSFSCTVAAVDNQVIYPLSGFENKTLKAALLDYNTFELVELGQMDSPTELVIQNVNPGQWYLLKVHEYSEQTDEWTVVFDQWVMM